VVPVLVGCDGGLVTTGLVGVFVPVEVVAGGGDVVAFGGVVVAGDVCFGGVTTG
jgi:hypothetical protein